MTTRTRTQSDNGLTDDTEIQSAVGSIAPATPRPKLWTMDLTFQPAGDINADPYTVKMVGPPGMVAPSALAVINAFWSEVEGGAVVS